MSAVAVRLTGLHDLPQAAALFDAYRQFYEQPADPALALQFIGDRMRNRESVILVAQTAGTEGSLVGFCQLYPGFCSVIAQPIYTLYDLYVAPEARKSGAGRALMLAAHAHAQATGFARLDLTTARTNHAAQALYESLGWVRDDVFLAYNKTV
ncbi:MULTISPECIES: GNAT family N-acetyltransferase [unclassified Polaromonas]|uniref:GNAT family N-acetyltransferase n=1 Tax=unclassified Polaromonas TaxID=2638319 RepID=UPI000F08E45A|nr:MULTISPECIES: GNAT family N-acetyltransferase [unclassified Polaromonas]AYQ28468.1 GNAT family N-acetyltransferase [Polaromonas sp. SP1]QGJ20413.1 GNAT family N-acetyltransferase [Polaromonas sp. Pch-P]